MHGTMAAVANKAAFSLLIAFGIQAIAYVRAVCKAWPLTDRERISRRRPGAAAGVVETICYFLLRKIFATERWSFDAFFPTSVWID